jgi:hypothetical protein
MTAVVVAGFTATTYAGAAASEPSVSPGTRGEPGGGAITFEAASATIVVDGNDADWSAIEGATVTLEQIRLEGLEPSQADEIDFGPLDPVDAILKVATDAENIYVLVEVPGPLHYNAADHNLSPSLAVQFRVDDPTAVHMGAAESDLESSLGIVDMWHWELDCGPGIPSGGAGIAGGDDPTCNLDDEYATTPEDRHDDGGGDVENEAAENSLYGVWSHTGLESGIGAEGTWIFEVSRPLVTGDPQDAQFTSGGTADIALAYFDPDEGPDGWSDAGHLQSAYQGWIEVTLK